MPSCGGDYRALCRMRGLVFRRGSRGACCLRGAKRAERTNKMKVCPVCKARVFDDMDTCYGCLHRFDSSDVEKAHGGGFEPEEPPGYSGKARNSAEAEEKKKAHALWTCAKKAKRMRNRLNGTSYFISRSRKAPQACGLPSILRDAPQLGGREPSMPSRRDGGIPSRLLPERAWRFQDRSRGACFPRR